MVVVVRCPAPFSTRSSPLQPDQREERGVIYVGHIPHGFYEDEMKKYFSQFGTVTRLKLSRSRKVGLHCAVDMYG